MHAAPYRLAQAKFSIGSPANRAQRLGYLNDPQMNRIACLIVQAPNRTIVRSSYSRNVIVDRIVIPNHRRTTPSGRSSRRPSRRSSRRPSRRSSRRPSRRLSRRPSRRLWRRPSRRSSRRLSRRSSRRPSRRSRTMKIWDYDSVYGYVLRIR